VKASARRRENEPSTLSSPPSQFTIENGNGISLAIREGDYNKSLLELIGAWLI